MAPQTNIGSAPKNGGKVNAREKLAKVIIKSEYSREFPDPFNKSDEETYKIEHHILLCIAIDVPSGISKAPNPREQRIDKGIYKTVRESLENKDDLSFHLKNKGITILAHKVEYSEGKKVATVYLGEDQGIADGGHTYEIILAAQSSGLCPEGQYVKFEVITGVPPELSIDITGGLNTAVQVDDASLMNLEGKFDWVKEELKDMPYLDKIAFKQNEDGKFDIREILALMTIFNVNLFPPPKHPKEAYISKAVCLDLYEANPDSFKMLRPILKDILFLHDYVHIKSKERYNSAKGGKAGLMAGVYASKKRNPYEFIFSGEESLYRLYDGTLYPMLGAMRFLVEQKKGKNKYSWKLDSFDEVLSLFDEIAPELVAKTYNISLVYHRKPNPIGKDPNHWDNLYNTVEVHYLRKYYSK